MVTSNTMNLASVQRDSHDRIKGLLKERLVGHYFPKDHDFSAGPPVRVTHGNAGLPGAASNSRRDAAIDYLWDRLESSGLVKVEYPPDEFVSYEDLAGDCYDVEYHRDTVPGGARSIKAQENAYKRHIEADGVCGIVTYWRTDESGDWEQADSVWGFIGQEDAEQSGYLEDCKAVAIGAIRKALKSRCPKCRQACRTA